jgi:glutamate racemase
MNNQQNPIGIFDSGIGGTSIWREIHHLLPNENTVYLADSKNAPYGEKSVDEIIALSIKNTEKLLQLKAKIIVVACNTATTNAIKILRENFEVPFIGIEPAIKPAALNSHTKVIGILATKGTLSSDLFHETSLKFKEIEIIEQIGYDLVPLIESGKIKTKDMRNLLTKYLKPMIDENIDHLVLGCSHYPYLIDEIKQILPSNINIIDSGFAVAKQTKHILETNNLLNPSPTSKQIFYTNVNKKILESFVKDYEVEEMAF